MTQTVTKTIENKEYKRFMETFTEQKYFKRAYCQLFCKYETCDGKADNLVVRTKKILVKI